MAGFARMQNPIPNSRRQLYYLDHTSASHVASFARQSDLKAQTLSYSLRWNMRGGRRTINHSSVIGILVRACIRQNLHAAYSETQERAYRCVDASDAAASAYPWERRLPAHNFVQEQPSSLFMNKNLAPFDTPYRCKGAPTA